MNEIPDKNTNGTLLEFEDEIKRMITLHPKDLTEKEERFRIILESIPALMLVFNKEEQLIYANPNLEEITGYSLIEIYQKGFKSKIFQEDVSKFDGVFRNHIYEKGAILDFRYLNKKGDAKWVRGLFSSLNLGKGKICVSLTLLDIDKIKDAELDSRKSNYFKNFFENHPDIVVLHDEEGVILDFNMKAEDKLKYSKEELLGKNLSYLGLTQKINSNDNDGESSKLSVLTKIVSRDGFAINVRIDRCCVEEDQPRLYMSIMKETSSFWLNKIENDHFERSISHIFQYLNLGFVFLDESGNILRLSSNCEDITGIALDGWNRSQPFLENLIRKEYFSKYKENIENALKGISTKNMVIEFETREKIFKKIRTGLLSASNDNYNSCKIILTLQDFSSDYVEINDFYRLLVNSAPVGIITFNKEGKYTSVNEEFLKMLAYEFDRETILSWNIYDLKDRDKILPGFVKALEGEFVGYIRDYMPIPSQQRFSFYQVFAPLKDEHDKIIGVLGLMSEITDNKIIPQNFMEAEERYRKVFDNLLDICIIHNAFGKISSFNPKTTEVLGYSGDEIIKKNFIDFFVDKESEKLEEKMFELQSFGNVEYDFEILTKDNSVLPVHVIGKGIEITGLQYFLEIIKILSKS
jgi:PAS domain S-box-containing protein